MLPETCYCTEPWTVFVYESAPTLPHFRRNDVGLKIIAVKTVLICMQYVKEWKGYGISCILRYCEIIVVLVYWCIIVKVTSLNVEY